MKKGREREMRTGFSWTCRVFGLHATAALVQKVSGAAPRT